MKQQLVKLTVLSSLIFSIATAYAAPPVAELKVKGTLKVPTCDVSAPDNGIYNFGKISSTKVSSSGVANLTPMTKNWVVTCDATTYLNIKPTDNRDDSMYPPSTSTYGLGMVNSTGKIGSYTLVLQNALVDGISSKLFSASTGTFTAVTAATLYKNGQSTGWASADNTQSAGRVFSADIIVSPMLAPTSIMKGPITEDTELDGSVTLNFAFGI
ncbi:MULTISPECIES: DUF1120 domain-containing protein [Yersinia]|uniref:Beta-fimbriae major subunit n=1 Tax=Yersinia intermedia TaxID=631 RepID=A0A0H5LSR7_YERIN|nr:MULTISPECIES: DUF1120 domain-containing protein [Yersinia]MCB5309017.1 DUF1120 domain-containing protein [Yersinia massiliensis]CRY54168.1 beta-fimbriae major subunit [Yersinia intermedia]